MFSTFAALSGLAFFLGLRMAGLAIVVLSFSDEPEGCLGMGFCRVVSVCGVLRWPRTGRRGGSGVGGSEGRLVVGRCGAAAPAALTALAALLAVAPAAAGGALAGTLVAAPAALATGAALAAAGGASGRPWVLLLTAEAGLAAAETALVATEAAAPAPALGAVDLGRGIPEGRSDLVDLHLDDGALLALLGVEGPGDEPAGHDDAGAAPEGLGNVLGRLAPDRAAHEQRLAVLPLVALAVERPRRRGHGEVRDGCARGGEAQLRVAGQVADEGDDGVACHVG
ncbi:membrane hypothetical protein [Nostocoides japonicum T1-X7]|uniref:Uncharacterized protein n=1 Tax=Nostocoides japonicum T1-X7 TaxID=1194083 RepID=A0A077M8R8_9MICO|nr:membrane hypothetical protein [Tetrasphaera japonica T1-X7]